MRAKPRRLSGDTAAAKVRREVEATVERYGFAIG